MIQHSNIPNNTCYKYDDLYCDMPYVFPSMFSYVCEHLCRLIYSKNDWVMTMFAICRPELDHFKFITVAVVVVVAVVDDDDFIIFYHNYLFWFYSHGLVDKPPFLIVIIPILLFGLVILAPTAKKNNLLHIITCCATCV